jgi:hypothetical protein
MFVRVRSEQINEAQGARAQSKVSDVKDLDYGDSMACD